MSDHLRRVSCLGIVFLVLLRISIGWQFLYEGLWKHQSQNTAAPWTAKGYLSNAQGPLRSFFRNLTGDPDDLNWLDHEKMVARWDAWQQRFTDHYKLDDAQTARLAEILNGPESYEVPLARLPEGVKLNRSLFDQVGFRAGPEPDAPGVLFLKPGQTLADGNKKRLLGFVTEKAEPEYHAALKRLFEKISTQAYKKSLEDTLVNDPAWSGKPLVDQDGNVIEEYVSGIEVYKNMLAEHEAGLERAETDFDHQHLKKTWSEDIQDRKKDLVNPIKAMETGLKADAKKMLTNEQRALGPVPAEPSRMQKIDLVTTWTLMILGGLLIAGFFTRVAALAGAGMVLSFYLVNPPWPGIPPVLGPEHSLIVDKNLIEVVALFALTFLPTGSWFGVDGIFRRLFVGEGRGSRVKGQGPDKR